MNMRNLAALGVLICAVSVPVEGAPAKNSRESSCAAKQLELSNDQIKKIAYSEFERRGGRIAARNVETKIEHQGCDWSVFVTFFPVTAGGHFTVIVDGTTGKVKEYIPGL